MRRISLGPPARWPAVMLLTALTGCGGGWVQDHPDLARRAQEDPGSFVAPALSLTDGLQSLGSNYSMRATKGVAGRSFDLYISVQRPDRIDILVQAPTGLTEAYLRANPREVGLFIRADTMLYSGPATRDAFERALGFGLSAADAVALLLGHGVDTAGRPRGLPRWDGEARRIRLDYGTGSRAWLHPLTLRFDRVEHDGPAGSLAAVIQEWLDALLPPVAERPGERAGGLQVEDLGTGRAPSVAVPSLLTLQVEPDDFRLRLRIVGEPQLNPEYPADFFELQRPAGVIERPLSDLSREGGLFRRLDEDGKEDR